MKKGDGGKRGHRNGNSDCVEESQNRERESEILRIVPREGEKFRRFKKKMQEKKTTSCGWKSSNEERGEQNPRSPTFGKCGEEKDPLRPENANLRCLRTR